MQVKFISPTEVVRHREARQRRELKVDDLVSSIQQNEKALPETMGLLTPIVLRAGNVLVAGERRLEAFTKLGRPLIPYYQYESLDEDQAQILELEENIKRLDLPWQDRVNAFEKVHLALCAGNAEWTQEQTAVRLGVSNANMSQQLAIAEGIRRDPKLKLANSASTAYSTLQREKERHLDDIATGITMTVRGIVGKPPSQNPSQRQNAGKIPVLPASGARPQISAPGAVVIPPSQPPELSYMSAEQSLINGDFTVWSKGYKGPRFNFIHCDFPYAAGMNKKGTQIQAGGAHQAYEDSEDIFWNLCYALLDSMSNVVAGSAHIIVWYQSGLYTETFEFFNSVAKKYDLTVFDTPLVWYKSDGSGVISDAARRYRHIYESALLISRGDRKIVRTVGDVYSGPITRAIHPSEKPEAMLNHFFRAIVSNTTRLLDPTAGSGSALRAAENIGAEFVYGLERDPTFHAAAVDELNRSRRKRALDALITKKET